MLRSMFTAISSLNQHQAYLDVVANNLANANTIGYKSARLLFQDQFSQMFSPGSAPTAANGGTNPTQVGLGVQTGFISPVFTQGALQSTGRNLDLALQGDGFFMYSQGSARRYSREGSMTMDSTGFIVNGGTGMRLQGWMADTTGKVDTNLPASDIQIPSNRTIAKATSNAIISGNLNADVIANPPSVDPTKSIPVTMGVYDTLGNLIPVTVYFRRAAADGTMANPDAWSYTTTDPVPTATYNPKPIWLDLPSAFDPATGHLPTVPAASITIPVTPGKGAGTSPASGTTFPVKLDISNLTQLNSPNGATVTSQDGLPAGAISDVFVTPNDGGIFLVYSNGMKEQIGQVAVARFTNPAGLIRANHTMFQVGMNSGDPQVGVANTGGRGPIAAGYLEGSNVDMAQEFTNMILAQRGFQASSRVITTSDEIIQELVNLKR